MEKQELREWLCETLGINRLTPMIERQVNRFVTEDGLTYKEVAQAVYFFIEVQGGSYQSKYGIGIVPGVIDDARKYFWKLKQKRDKQIESVEEAKKIPEIILEVGQIRKRRKLKPIDITKIEID